MSDVKVALIACLAALPILFGVGWMSEIFAKAAVGMVVVSHGGDPKAVMDEAILPSMVGPLLLIWLISSAITLLLAKAGMLPHRLYIPPPPPWVDDNK